MTHRPIDPTNTAVIQAYLDRVEDALKDAEVSRFEIAQVLQDLELQISEMIHNSSSEVGEALIQEVLGTLASPEAFASSFLADITHGKEVMQNEAPRSASPPSLLLAYASLIAPVFGSMLWAISWTPGLSSSFKLFATFFGSLIAICGAFSTFMIYRKIRRNQSIWGWLVFACSLLLLFENDDAKVIAMDDLPTVRATSNSVDIVDGSTKLPGIWNISPEVELDTYYARHFRGTKTIRFKTDIDMVEFLVEPGKEYDFVVLLDDKKRCLTRISTLHTSAERIAMETSKDPVVIPFRIADDHRMHCIASINNSSPLDFVFDIGADTTVVFPSAISKGLKLQYNGSIENVGLGGGGIRPTSSDNQVAISDLRWSHESVMLVEKQAELSDGLLGWNLFEDRVLEIDFDNQTMLVHDTPPTVSDEWRQTDLNLEGTTPRVKIEMQDGNRTIEDWSIFDTGYREALYLSHGFATHWHLPASMKNLGRNVSHGTGNTVVQGYYYDLPKLTLGALHLEHVPISIEATNTGAHRTALLGMDAIKRSNHIIDFQNGRLYSKPNQFADAAFEYRPVASRSWMPAILLCMVISLPTASAFGSFLRRARSIGLPSSICLACGVAIPIVYFGMQLVAAPFYPNFSILSTTASELGSNQSSYAFEFNTCIILLGCFFGLASLAFLATLWNSNVSRWATVLLTISVALMGVQTAWAGLHPMPDPRHGGHALFIIAMLLVPFFLFCVHWRLDSALSLRIYFGLSLLVLLCMVPIMSGLTGVDTRTYGGILQRILTIAIFPPIGVSAYVLATTKLTKRQK